MTGHLKLNKLLQFLKLQYFWTSMAKYVKKFINKCNVCSKICPFINFRPLKLLKLITINIVSLDTAHITMPSGIKKYIVVANDHFTCRIEVKILTNESSQSKMNLLNKKY